MKEEGILIKFNPPLNEGEACAVNRDIKSLRMENNSLFEHLQSIIVVVVQKGGLPLRPIVFVPTY